MLVLILLLVEDDATTSAHIAEGLVARGHEVEVAADGRTGLVRGADMRFECLIIDRMLPGFDGLTLVRTLRTTGVRTPIIFLTAVGGVADRVQGLRAGADDYLVKPFELAELDARIEAIGRRPPLSSAATLLRAGGLELDRLARTVSLHGQRVELTASEFKIVELLLLNAGHPVTKAMMVEAVFGLDHPAPAAIIEPHVSRLRTKLQPTTGPAKADDLIRTVRGVGYLIDAG